MKWNGIVSQRSHRTIASRFAIENPNHASSTDLRRRNAIPGMADGLDRGGGAELLAQSTDADVDDVRARVEVISPDVGEEALAADHLARALDEVMEQLELPVGEIDDKLAEAG